MNIYLTDTVGNGCVRFSIINKTKMKDFIISMLSQGGISSKRVWASIMTAILCGSYIYCTVTKCEMPEATYGFLSLDAVLLGIESVVKPFSKHRISDEEN